MAGRTPNSVDEIISSIKRSNLPFILVEDTSKDMAEVYRKIESKIGITNATIEPCGGRGPLLDIYDRRSEFPNKKVVYIADKDMWVFSGVPEKYNEVCFTQGYSIENDLYTDGKEPYIDILLEEVEIEKRTTILGEIIQWYASKVEKYLDGTISNCEFSDVTFLNKSILDRTTNQISPVFKTRTSYIEPNPVLVGSITSNYSLQLRGKFLFQVLLLIFKGRGRGKARHEKRELMDACLRYALLDENSNINKLINCLKSKLGLNPSEVANP